MASIPAHLAPPGEAEIHGTVHPAFAGVRAAFAENYAPADGDAGRDIGSSCAVTIDGQLVVDLWGGHRDMARRLPWEADTIVNLWSTTKMVTALCVLMLHDRGDLDIDTPVADYWPEFAAAGKGGGEHPVLVRHVLAHTAGLAAFEEPVRDTELFDWAACSARLAAQAPGWTPGDGSGYHAETQGWLNGEIIRRVDGRTVGAFWKDEVAEPLGIDFHIGLDDSHFPRVADLATLDADTGADTSGARSLTLANTGAWRRYEMPASGGHGNARAVAQAMTAIANDGTVTGPNGTKTVLSPATIERIFEVQSDRVDRVLGRKIRFGIGYGLHSEDSPLGVNDRSCWWAGWGGSMCVVDVENSMTVSFVPNRMLGDDDLRAVRTIFAAHAGGQQLRDGS